MTKKKIEPESEKETFWQRINGNDATDEDKTALQEIYDESPDIVQRVADISGNVVEEILKEHMPSSFATREGFRYKLKAMRESLGWSDSSEIERLLIEQVCLTWLRLNVIEYLTISKLRQSHTVETGLYWNEIWNSSQSRHLKATESLAKVRKLLAEANFREQQGDEKRAKVAAIGGKAVKQLNAAPARKVYFSDEIINMLDPDTPEMELVGSELRGQNE